MSTPYTVPPGTPGVPVTAQRPVPAYYRQPLGLPAGSVRAILTFIVLGLVWTVMLLPKDKTGCPGWWLFEVAWDYIVQNQNAPIQGVRGDWTSGDNLDTVNRLTAGHRMTLEEASKQTWTYQQAQSKGFTRYQYIDAQGSPGQYTSVDVVFLS